MKDLNEIPIPVVQNAKERTLRVVGAIKAAMAEIARELAENDGIYPHNKGRLSMAEVCRRAGVHSITMAGAAHCDTTRPMVQSWIKQVWTIRGRAKVRKVITRRSDEADERYRWIASQFQAMYQIEIPRRDEEIATLQRRVKELEATNAQLQDEISRGRVVQLPVERRSRK